MPSTWCATVEATFVTWNSLPGWVVSANTSNTFSIRLNKFWHNQDIIYNFRVQLQGTAEVVESFYTMKLSKELYNKMIR